MEDRLGVSGVLMKEQPGCEILSSVDDPHSDYRLFWLLDFQPSFWIIHRIPRLRKDTQRVIPVVTPVRYDMKSFGNATMIPEVCQVYHTLYSLHIELILSFYYPYVIPAKS